MSTVIARQEADLASGRVDIGPDGHPYPTTSWRPVDLGPVLRGERAVAPPAWLPRTDGERLLYPGRSHSFFGPSETLKSWVALLACQSVLEAGERALYIDFEDEAESFVERARLLGIADGDIGTRLVYIRPEDPVRRETPTEFDLGWAKGRVRPALVVLDGVSEAFSLHSWDVLSATDTVKYQQAFLRGFPGSTTLEIDHTAKTEGRGQFGSQHKRAGINGASYEFYGAHVEGEGGHSTVKLRVSKDRHGRVRKFAPQGEAGTFHLASNQEQVAWIEPHDGRTADDRVKDRTLDFLFDHPGATTRQVRAGVRGSNASIDRALAALVEEGVAEQGSGPNGARVYSMNGDVPR